MPPPERMPLRMGGNWRKRWRYVGAYDERFMLCAAAIEIGPGRETFWALWDREERALRENTRHVVPLLAGPEVSFGENSVSVRSRDVEIDLELGAGQAIECTCPAGDGGYTWTRKLAGASAEGVVRVGSRETPMRGRAVDDLSAGYHARRTSWLWSAGVGDAADGRRVAWNLVSGINDPEDVERAGHLGRRRADRARAGHASTASTRSASRTGRCSGSSPRPLASAPRACRASSAPTTRRRSARSRAPCPGSSW